PSSQQSCAATFACAPACTVALKCAGVEIEDGEETARHPHVFLREGEPAPDGVDVTWVVRTYVEAPQRPEEELPRRHRNNSRQSLRNASGERPSITLDLGWPDERSITGTKPGNRHKSAISLNWKPNAR